MEGVKKGGGGFWEFVEGKGVSLLSVGWFSCLGVEIALCFMKQAPWKDQ